MIIRVVASLRSANHGAHQPRDQATRPSGVCVNFGCGRIPQ